MTEGSRASRVSVCWPVGQVLARRKRQGDGKLGVCEMPTFPVGWTVSRVSVVGMIPRFGRIANLQSR
jgi:hypothetical protein